MTKPEYRILIVDDEPDIIEILTYNLNLAGYKVFTAENGKDGIELAKKCLPHLIILDVMMPVMDGVETCEQIRSIDTLKNSVIVFLTARSEDYSQIAAFDAGADDYLTKPVKIKVFLSKVKSLLKRSGENNSERNREMLGTKIKIGNLEIDREKHIVLIDGKEMMLPKKEFQLLLLLSSKPGKVFTRDIIFSHIWDDNVIVVGRTIDVHIRKLREKIGSSQIETIKGVGYKFKE